MSIYGAVLNLYRTRLIEYTILLTGKIEISKNQLNKITHNKNRKD